MMRIGLTLLLTALAAPVSAETLEALVEEQARGLFGAELPETAGFDITLQQPAPGEAVMLSAFRMDKSTGQFLANAVTRDGGVLRVMGLAIPTVTVAVPTRRMLPDEIITLADLQDVELPLGRVGAFAVTSSDALVGMQVRRVLSQGRPVQSQSVMQPLVIGRGDRVSIRYDDGRMSLSAPGRSLDDAHRGEQIRVVNLSSNKTILAVARADGVVEVSR